MGMRRRRRGQFKATPFRKRRRPARSFAMTRGRVARRERRLNPRTAGFLGIELKFYDQRVIQSALTAPTDATGGEHNPSATISLNTVTQGDGESQRDGREILMQRISIRGIIRIPPQANQIVSSEPTVCWVALVLDTQTNGALLNSENVVTNIGSNAITAASPFNNLQFSKRFRIMAKRQMTFDAPAYATFDGTNIEQGGMTKVFEFHVPLKIKVNYTDTTETIANIVDNGLNIIAFCNNTELAPTLSYSSRLRFNG